MLGSTDESPRPQSGTSPDALSSTRSVSSPSRCTGCGSRALGPESSACNHRSNGMARGGQSSVNPYPTTGLPAHGTVTTRSFGRDNCR